MRILQKSYQLFFFEYFALYKKTLQEYLEEFNILVNY